MAGCCELQEIASIRTSWTTTVTNDRGDDDIARITSACIRCGRLGDDPRWQLSESSLFELRARERIGRNGDWRTLLLPRFHRLGRTVAAASIIAPTIRRRRVVETIAKMTDANLEGIIRKYMGLAPSLWPRSIVSPAWRQPLIVHHGLALKSALKRDIDHVFLCSYTADTIQYPTEAWLGTHRGRPRLRFLKKLATHNDHHTLLVSVYPNDSIVATAYMLDDQQHEVNREGTFVFASWAAPE